MKGKEARPNTNEERETREINTVQNKISIANGR